MDKMMNNTNNNNTNIILSPFQTFTIITLTSISASLQISLQVLIGMILSHPSINILSTHVNGSLSKILFYILWPFFMIEKFALSINYDLLKDVWVVFLMGGGLQIGGMVVSQMIYPWYRLSKCIKPSSRFLGIKRTILIYTIAFKNFAFLPLMFMETFSKSTIFVDPKREENYAAIITIFSIPEMVIVYSIGVIYFEYSANYEKKMRRKEKEKIIESENNNNNNTTEENDITKKELKNVEKSDGKDLSVGEKNVEKSESIIIRLNTQNKGENRCMKITKKVLFIVKKVLSPAMIGIIIGTLISVIPNVKGFIFDDPPLIVDVVPIIIKKFSSTITVIAMLITGANLGNSIFVGKEKDDKEKKEGETNEKKIKRSKREIVKDFFKNKLLKHNSYYNLVLNISVKLFLMPLIFLGVTTALAFILKNTNIVSKELRPTVYLICVIEAAAPAMLSLNAFASLYGAGVEELSEIMIAQYFISPISMVIFCIASLYIFCSIEKEQCTLFG